MAIADQFTEKSGNRVVHTMDGVAVASIDQLPTKRLLVLILLRGTLAELLGLLLSFVFVELLYVVVLFLPQSTQRLSGFLRGRQCRCVFCRREGIRVSARGEQAHAQREPKRVLRLHNRLLSF